MFIPSIPRSAVSRGVWGDRSLPLAGEGVPATGNVSALPIHISYRVVSVIGILTCLRPRLSNDKPSAIFRLRGTFTPGASAGPAAFTGGTNPTLGGDVTATLGIAIEPLSQISQNPPDLVNTNGGGTVAVPNKAADPGYLAEQIVKHLFNFVSSFVGAGVVDQNTLVPMSAIARWYEGFRTKLKNMGPGFLDRAGD